MAKLHPDTVRQLRRYHSRGYSIASLVDAFGLSRSCVHGVVSGKTHRNVSHDDALPPLAEIIRAKPKRLPDGAPAPVKQPAEELTLRYTAMAESLQARRRRQRQR